MIHRHARSASAKRLILNTLSTKRERKARANAKLAHERLLALMRSVYPDYDEMLSFYEGSQWTDEQLRALQRKGMN